MKFLLLITAYLLISKLFAEELKITDINQVSNKASNSLLPPEIGCPEKCNEGSKENCSSIVENFCDTLGILQIMEISFVMEVHLISVIVK